MQHPNAQLLETLYAGWNSGTLQTALAVCPDAITFQVPGKSKVAGKYSKTTFATEFAMRLQELSNGTFTQEVHDILASDRHATVIVTEKLIRDGKSAEFRMVHVWRFEAGQPVAWYAYPRDLYQFDACWA